MPESGKLHVSLSKGSSAQNTGPYHSSPYIHEGQNTTDLLQKNTSETFALILDALISVTNAYTFGTVSIGRDTEVT